MFTFGRISPRLRHVSIEDERGAAREGAGRAGVAGGGARSALQVVAPPPPAPLWCDWLPARRAASATVHIERLTSAPRPRLACDSPAARTSRYWTRRRSYLHYADVRSLWTFEVEFLCTPYILHMQLRLDCILLISDFFILLKQRFLPMLQLLRKFK